MSLQRWFYRSGRPNRPARLLDRATAAIYARGVAPDYLVTLEVRGRRSGRTIRFPLVMVAVGGERYLVSMLGQNANWVRNVRAAGGEAILRHGRREEVHLEELAVDRRAPVLAAVRGHETGWSTAGGHPLVKARAAHIRLAYTTHQASAHA
jgi:deazaflavin-dependent oxidoreductase (nitroreductase family)